MYFPLVPKTKAVQQTEVGDGLALGVLAAGFDSLRNDKTAIELAFRHVWRRWPHTSSYPLVKAGPATDDIYVQIMLRSASRVHKLAAWRIEGYLICPELVHESWTLDDTLEELADASGVSEAGWRQLGTDFLKRINKQVP